MRNDLDHSRIFTLINNYFRPIDKIKDTKLEIFNY